MTRALIHIAGDPKGRVQLCVRCGAVLTDNRHSTYYKADPATGGMEETGLSYWRVGDFVELDGGSGGVVESLSDGTACTAPMNDGGAP